MVLDQVLLPIDTTVRTVVEVTHTQYSGLVLAPDLSFGSNTLCKCRCINTEVLFNSLWFPSMYLPMHFCSP